MICSTGVVIATPPRCCRSVVISSSSFMTGSLSAR
jgi:hypothetical protein